MARRVMSLVLLAAAVAALCRSTAFVAAPKDMPRADVLAALAPMVLGAQKRAAILGMSKHVFLSLMWKN